MSQSGDIPSFPRIRLFWIVFRKVYTYCVIIGGISAIIAKHKVSGKRRGKVPNRVTHEIYIVIEERIKKQTNKH